MSFHSRHAGRDPVSRDWGPGAVIPAKAGMTAGAGWLYGIVNCSRLRAGRRGTLSYRHLPTHQSRQQQVTRLGELKYFPF